MSVSPKARANLVAILFWITGYAIILTMAHFSLISDDTMLYAMYSSNVLLVLELLGLFKPEKKVKTALLALALMVCQAVVVHLIRG